jgi:hypothetical protein
MEFDRLCRGVLSISSLKCCIVAIKEEILFVRWLSSSMWYWRTCSVNVLSG